MSEENDSPKTIKIEHCRTSNYSSHFATGAICSGPTSDGMYHLTFFSEARRVKQEVGTPVNNEALSYSVSIDKTDIEDFREDKVTISVTAEVARNIAGLINQVVEIK